MKTDGVVYRDAVRVTWSALRGAALWPGWQEKQPGQEAAPAVESAGRVWAAVQERGERVGLAFGCGAYRDRDGDEREAACRVVGAQVLAYPGPWSRDTAEVTARIEFESETRHGPNSFALGRELAWRLSGARWRYAPGAVAAMEVVRVETYAPQVGWVRIYPGRPSVL